MLTLVPAVLVLSRPERLSARSSRPCPDPAIHIFKKSGELVVRCENKVHLKVSATFGGKPTGNKLRSGDQRTPEGQYQVCTKHRSRNTYRFLGIDYPAERDAKAALRRRQITRAQYEQIMRARRAGRCPPYHTSLGGAVGIHGVEPSLAWASRLWTRLSRIGGLHRHLGFTDGCIAVTNEAVDRIWSLVTVGTPVHIHPE